MNKIDVTWKIFMTYMLILLFILFLGTAFGQTKFCDEDVCVVEVNAGWNEGNSVDYLGKLKDCGIKRISIDKGDWQEKYKIVIVPTVVIFNGKEVKRFQADLSFKLLATREEIQETIDEILMSDF